VGESESWREVVDCAKQDRLDLCNIHLGKRLSSALYGTYSITLNELRSLLQASVTKAKTGAPGQDKPTSGTQTVQSEEPEDGFRQQRRRKLNSSSEEIHDKNLKIASPVAGNVQLYKKPTSPSTTTCRNYFAPLRSLEMEANETTSQRQQQQEATTNTGGRPPPIFLTSAVKLIHLLGKLRGIVKGNFEFRNIRNGTRVVTKEIEDVCAIRVYHEANNLNYFTFHPKSEKPIMAVIRNLPIQTPSEDISKGLEELGYSIISVKQVTASRPSPERIKQINLPLFLITLARNDKSPDIFKLSTLCHIVIKAEAYKVQNDLKQCFNCQKFGNIWVNCRQPLCCLWCGGGHLHKECPEKKKENSTPTYCNCNLKEGDRPHPCTYRGCSMRRRRCSGERIRGPSKKIREGYLLRSSQRRNNPSQRR
jgi:hypothetical protein